jgi:hypothetical protein
MHKRFIAAAVAAVLGVSSLAAQAEDLFDDGHVDGELRLYDFSRLYQTHDTPDARALSLAALINARTGTFGGGFSFGTSFVTANALGTRSGNPAKVDTSLMGPDNALAAFSQLYLQFKNDWLLFRGGYQYLDNPWMGNNDSRVIPSSYNAILVGVTPAAGWNIYAIRAFSWKSRTSDGMYRDNLYYPATFDGDEMYGNNGSLPATARRANGTTAIGTTYARGGLKVQGWYYDFLDFAHTGYADGTYTFKTGTGFDPSLAVQFLNQTSGGGNVLVDTQTKLLGVAGDRVRSRAWGADVGTTAFDGRIDLAYDKLEREAGAVGAGALISPYTSGYATDPLFTTSMIRGLVEEGPGHAWKAKLTYNFLDKRLQVVAAYAKYTTELRGDSHDLYFDVVYHLDNLLRGLTLRDRWERSSGGIANLNPGNKAFTYNRLMITYKF